jgi:hypothetical protein
MMGKLSFVCFLGGTISHLFLQGLYFSGLLDILPFDLLDNISSGSNVQQVFRGP